MSAPILFGVVAPAAAGDASGGSRGSRVGRGPKLPYVAGLDGIRAVSIVGIMSNHGGLGWANGGFISVNVFFVLSGFLITSLLVKELAATGTIRLRSFWGRRARRLLPALFVLLAGIAVYGWLVAPGDTRGTLRSDGLATLLYVANWHQIFAGQSYFAQTASVSPLLHTWTLAIEEQFYLVWPLIVLALWKLSGVWFGRRASLAGHPDVPRRSTSPLLILAVVSAVGSAVEMALLFHPGTDPSRMYYGTDTRAQDLLVGAALALLPAVRREVSYRVARFRWLAGAVGLAGVAGFALEWSRLTANSYFPYRGGFLLADILTAGVIFGVTRAPGSPLARVLGWKPVAYVGKISYGLYLWHWPVFVVVDHARTGLSGYGLFALRSGLSFALAVASSRFIEMPIRRGAIRSWRAWVSLPATAGATAAALVLSTAVPVATAGTLSSPAAWKQTPGAAATADLGPGQYFGFRYPETYASLTHDVNALKRVLFLGDSISWTLYLGIYKQAVKEGLAIIPRGIVGCGLSVATPLEVKGVVGDPFPGCDGWPTWWANDVAYYKPSVVCIISGYWEAVDRYLDGRWQHLGDPEFDAYVTTQLEKAVAIASAGGATVALFTSPNFDDGEQPDGRPWPESDSARVDEYNAIVQAVAARHPGTVAVVPFGTYLDPGGHFTTTIRGVTVRGSDGIHTTMAGDALIAPELLAQLARLSY